MAELVKIENEIVKARDMKCGQVGIIRSWSYCESVGVIVQRFEDKLIAIGEDSENSWSGGAWDDECTVEILGRGSVIRL